VKIVREEFGQGDEFAQEITYKAEVARFRGAGEDPPASFDVDDGVWKLRQPVEDRIREKLERSMPHEASRRQALDLLAFAMENADAERSDAWYVRETSEGLP
jgi:hypothetical protein